MKGPSPLGGMKVPSFMAMPPSPELNWPQPEKSIVSKSPLTMIFSKASHSTVTSGGHKVKVGAVLSSTRMI
jgi:hypothetical protein